MYRCKECGLIFEDPKMYSEDRTPGGSFEGGSFIETYFGCPKCEGNYEEVEYNEELEKYMIYEEIKQLKKEREEENENI